MFKAYASSESSEKKEDEKKPNITSTIHNNDSNWLANKSFSIEPPVVEFVQQISHPIQATTTTVNVKPKEEKKKPIQNIVTKSKPTTDELFYIDRRRDRANITVQYTHGVPRYGNKFCNQHPLGSRIAKRSSKQRPIRYFHHKLEDITDTHSKEDNFVTVDKHVEQLNRTVREQPHLFDAWKELIDYQLYLFKKVGQTDRLTSIFNKQLVIIDRALELNGNRLQYRLLKLNIRTNSRLTDNNILLNEWTTLIKDCQKSSDDRTIHEAWFSYIRFLLNHIEVFSIEKLNEVFVQYFSTYNYHLQTRSEKERKSLLNYMLDMFQIWVYVLREAGYFERGLSLYQTMIEIHLNLFSENKTDFSKKLEIFENNWDTDKSRFGEKHAIDNPISYIENELSSLSEQENNLINSDYKSWTLIERQRIDFYRLKIVNYAIHFHSNLIRQLSDSSQIDTDIVNVKFDNSIRPFLFHLIDQTQFVQLIIYYLHFLNGLPQLTILNEILSQLKLSLSNQLQEQLFIDNEFTQFHPFMHSTPPIQTEEYFQLEYISNIYEHIIAIPYLKSFQIDFILLYWYYLAANVLEVKQQSQTQYKNRLKSLQSIIRKYLSLEEYRTCLRLYTHYGRLEYEYFQRTNEGRRIFDLCLQTIRTNPTNFTSYQSNDDLCYWISTSLICEFNLNHSFDNMMKIILQNSKYTSINKQINNEKLRSSIDFVLNKLFSNTQLNDVITLILDCLKSRKFSKWDQKSDQDWSTYLRQNPYLSFELLFIFLNYSYLLNDPFDKLHNILLNSILPLIHEQRNKKTQAIIDYILLFYVTVLWDELFTEHLLFSQSTNYIKQILEHLQYPSIILIKFTSIYTCLLPLYGSYAKEFEQTISSYKFNKKPEYHLITKMFILKMDLIRHMKLQKASGMNDKSNSGYEHRVRNIIRELIQEYPYYVQLWNFYEMFENNLSNKERVNAVLYNAMQNCPWSKILYMKSITNATNETEWKLFLNVMHKSNIRILFPIEEFNMLKELIEMKT